jgi:hypothetical protein
MICGPDFEMQALKVRADHLETRIGPTPETSYTLNNVNALL